MGEIEYSSPYATTGRKKRLSWLCCGGSAANAPTASFVDLSGSRSWEARDR
jgi:hypothetical protein